MRPPLQPAPPDMEARPCTPPVTETGPQRLRQTPTRRSTRAASQAYWAFSVNLSLPPFCGPTAPPGTAAQGPRKGHGYPTRKPPA